MIDVTISMEHGDEDLTEDILDSVETVINLCEELEGVKFDNEVSVTFVSDEDIRLMNREYRDIDKTTDVLSFPMYEKADLELENKRQTEYIRQLGDIVISVDKAKKQAEEFGHGLKREICYLACHSMFHLMGYDHMTEEEKTVMRQKEEEIMSKLKITR